MTHLTLLARLRRRPDRPRALTSAGASRGTSEFFVAGRRLGAPMLFATLLAANIGAGSTIGAASYGYRDGLSAWWWVGSAAMGSVVLGLWVGPRIRRHRRRRTTCGRSATSSSGATTGASAPSAASLLWIGTLAILGRPAPRLVAMLEAVAGWPRWIGAVARRPGRCRLLHRRRHAVVGLGEPGAAHGASWSASCVALPFAFGAVGGYDGLRPGDRPAAPTGACGAAAPPAGSTWRCSARRSSCRPGILQKVYGARDDRAVRDRRAGQRRGAVRLRVHAGAAGHDRARPPSRPAEHRAGAADAARPRRAARRRQPRPGRRWSSAEISAADAALFMLATSLSQDLYKRFVQPAGDRRRGAARGARARRSAAGSPASPSRSCRRPSATRSKFFYTLLSVSLFVPVIAGLASRRTGAARSAGRDPRRRGDHGGDAARHRRARCRPA